MGDLCLSRTEVAELCRSPQRRKQAEFLRRNGIRHYLDAHGWPVVLRAAVAAEVTGPAAEPAWKPNKAA